jgi:hypothetical protein
MPTGGGRCREPASDLRPAGTVAGRSPRAQRLEPTAAIENGPGLTRRRRVRSRGDAISRPRSPTKRCSPPGSPPGPARSTARKKGADRSGNGRRGVPTAAGIDNATVASILGAVTNSSSLVGLMRPGRGRCRSAAPRLEVQHHRGRSGNPRAAAATRSPQPARLRVGPDWPRYRPGSPGDRQGPRPGRPLVRPIRPCGTVGPGATHPRGGKLTMAQDFVRYSPDIERADPSRQGPCGAGSAVRDRVVRRTLARNVEATS